MVLSVFQKKRTLKGSVELSRIKCVEIVKSDIIIPCQYKYPFQVSLSIDYIDKWYHFMLNFSKILLHNASLNGPNTAVKNNKWRKSRLIWNELGNKKVINQNLPLLHSHTITWLPSVRMDERRSKCSDLLVLGLNFSSCFPTAYRKNEKKWRLWPVVMW